MTAPTTDRYTNVTRLADFYENSFPGVYADYELKAVTSHPALGLDPETREIAQALIDQVFDGATENLPVTSIVTSLREWAAVIQPTSGLNLGGM